MNGSTRVLPSVGATTPATDGGPNTSATSGTATPKVVTAAPAQPVYRQRPNPLGYSHRRQRVDNPWLYAIQEDLARD